MLSQQILDFDNIDLRVLETNDILSDSDRNQVKIQQQVTRQQLSVLDAEIALADLDVDNDTIAVSTHDSIVARKKRRKLKALLAACDVAIALHKLLPPELLAHIFLLAFNVLPTYLPPQGRTSSPLPVTHTCSRWRIIALSLPELWSDVVLDNKPGWDRNTSMNLVDEWYSRTGHSKPLSLEVATSFSRKFEPEDNTLIQRLVVPYAHRYEDLTLSLPESKIFFLFNMPNVSLPLLKSVKLIKIGPIQWSHPQPDNPDATSIFRSSNAPKLTRVILSRFSSLRRKNLTDLFSWTNITCFHCDDPLSVLQGMTLLRKCPRIEDCQLTLMSTHIQRLTPEPSIQLPSLRRIDLTFGSDFDHFPRSPPFVQLVFDRLATPNLKDFNLRAPKETTTWTESSLIAFFARSGCAIEILEVENFYLSEDVLFQLAKLLPSLTVLYIGLKNLVSKATLVEMTNGDLLPKLSSLICRIDHLETFVEMLEKRWTTSLVDLTVGRPAFYMLEYAGPTINHSQAVRVDLLRAQGVKIEMSHGAL